MHNIDDCCGLRVNLDKTECIWIGSNTGREPGNIPAKWSAGDFATLGVKFLRNEQDMQFENFNDKFQLMHNVLNIWKMRDLSLIWKVLVVKTLEIF